MEKPYLNKIKIKKNLTLFILYIKKLYKTRNISKQEFTLGIFLIPIGLIIGGNWIQKILLTTCVLILMVIDIKYVLNTHPKKINLSKYVASLLIINLFLVWAYILFLV
jgi:hypothetical protein